MLKYPNNDKPTLQWSTTHLKIPTPKLPLCITEGINFIWQVTVWRYCLLQQSMLLVFQKCKRQLLVSLIKSIIFISRVSTLKYYFLQHNMPLLLEKCKRMNTRQKLNLLSYMEKILALTIRHLFPFDSSIAGCKSLKWIKKYLKISNASPKALVHNTKNVFNAT